MCYRSNIRIPIRWIYIISIFSSYIIAIAEWSIRRGMISSGFNIQQFPSYSYFVVAALFIILGIIKWLRYRNSIYPVLGLLLGALTAHGPFVMTHNFFLLKVTYFINLVIIVFFVVINWNSFYSQERFELIARRLFRLVAERLDETGIGFAERPFSAGRARIKLDQLPGFSRYLHSKYIVRPFYLEESISLAFSMNTSLMVIDEP